LGPRLFVAKGHIVWLRFVRHSDRLHFVCDLRSHYTQQLLSSACIHPGLAVCQ
jgi:hypothetical protein